MITEQAMKIYGSNGQDKDKHKEQKKKKKKKNPAPEEKATLILIRAMKFNKPKNIPKRKALRL